MKVTDYLRAGLDPVALARLSGLDPDPWQEKVLRSTAQRLCQLPGSEQVGALPARTVAHAAIARRDDDRTAGRDRADQFENHVVRLDSRRREADTYRGSGRDRRRGCRPYRPSRGCGGAWKTGFGC